MSTEQALARLIELADAMDAAKTDGEWFQAQHAAAQLFNTICAQMPDEVIDAAAAIVRERELF